MTKSSTELAGALELAEVDLGLVLEYRSVLLPRHIHPLAVEVWPIIRRRMAELRTLLLEAHEGIDDHLAAAGLTGVQLEMKLGAYRTASSRAREYGPPRVATPPRVFRKLFKSLLGWLNVWLGSLVAAIGAGEAVKEFKEFLEQAVDDADNLE